MAGIGHRGLGDEDIASLAYTLQVGREAMESRLAVMARVDGGAGLEAEGDHLAGKSGIEELYRGEVRREKEALSVLAGEDIAPIVDGWVEKGRHGKLLELWVKGLSFDWQRLYGEAKPRRISLPTYPFAREAVLDRGNRQDNEEPRPERGGQQRRSAGDQGSMALTSLPTRTCSIA